METVFIRILNMSLAAAVAIAAVLLVRLLLRRAPKKWSYLLWIAPAFRLCCPVSLKAAFSLFRLRPIAPAVQTLGAQTAAVAYVPQNIGMMAQPRLEIGTQRISETVSSVLPAPAPAASVNPLQIWLAVGAALWCAGMLAMLVYAAVSYVKTKRLLSDAVLLRDMVYETDRIRAPFLLGLFRPRIYVPAGLDEDTLRFVLAHERFHLRRGDHVVKALAFLLLTVHWFNPLCWLAFALMSRDMEMRCDESVLAAQGSGGKDYSRALLSFAAGRRFPAPSPLAFGETGVKARIRNALRWKKPRAWASILAAVLCLAVVAACAANPAEKADKADKLPGYKRDAAQPLETEQTLPAAAQTALDAFLQARKVEGSAKGDYAQKYERFELMRVLYQNEAQIFALLRDESKSNRPLAERPLLLLTLKKQSGAWQVADTPEWQGVKNGLAAVEDRAAELFAQYSTPPARSEIDRALALLGDCEVLANCFPPAGSTAALWEGFFAAYPGQVELFYDESQTAELVSRAFFRSFGVENMDFASPTFVISLKKSCEIDDERFLSNIGFFFEENGDGDTIQIAVQVKPDGVYYMKADPWAVYAQNGWRVSDSLGAQVPAPRGVPTEPAALEIVSRQGSVRAWMGSYSWSYDAGNGQRRGIEADSCSPLEEHVELPTLETRPDTISQGKPNYVSLLFGFEPASVSVVCWDEAASPTPESPGEPVTVEQRDGVFGFELREGSRVYELSVSYRADAYEGLAYYAFRGQYLVPVLSPAAPTGGELFTPDFASGAELYVEEGFTCSYSQTESGAGKFAETPHAVWRVTGDDLREAIPEICGELRQYRQIERAGDVMNGTPERLDCLPCAYLVTDSVCYRVEVVNWENFAGGAWAGLPIRAERYGEPTLQVSRLDLSRMPDGETPVSFAKAYFGPDSLNGADGAGWYSTLSQDSLNRLLLLLGSVGADNAEIAEKLG